MGEEVLRTADVLTPEDPYGESHRRALVRNTAVMSVGTALSRATGFLRVIATAVALGVGESRLADAYNVANTTPNIIYELVLGGILTSVFVPVFVEWLEKRGPEAVWHSARVVLTFALVSLTSVMVLGMLGASAIIHLYTINDHGSNREAYRALASFFLIWFLPQIVFYAIGAVASGLLNAHRRFALPMFAPIVNNVLVIATFVVFMLLPGPSHPTESSITELQRYVLALGTTLGVIGMSLVLWPAVRSLGFRFRWTWDLRDEAFRRIGRLAGWTLVYVVANQIGYLFVIILANRHQGDYTAYSYAFIFFQLPHAIFSVSVITALLPSMSSRWSDHDVDGYRTLLSQGIRGTAFVIVPGALAYIALAGVIVAVLLQHGLVTATDTHVLASLIRVFSIGLLSFSTFQLFLRSFYAMQDTRTPAIINIFAVALNTTVNFIYYRYFGVEGLALGHATAYTFASIVALLVLRRRLGGIEGRRLAFSLTKILVASVAAVGAAWGVSHGVQAALGVATFGPQLVQLLAAVTAGLLTFVVLCLVLRIEEFDMVKRTVMARVGR